VTAVYYFFSKVVRLASGLNPDVGIKLPAAFAFNIDLVNLERSAFVV
jgi:hypothetical protein